MIVPKIKPINFKKLSKKREKIAKECIKKFFYEKISTYIKLSRKSRRSRNIKLPSLGLEASLEIIFKMFENNTLVIEAIDPDNFMIYTINSRKEKMLVEYFVEGYSIFR